MSQQQIVEGWANSAYGPRGTVYTNAVVVAPDATAEGLVSWAIGQVQQLNILLTVIGTAKHGSVEQDPAELCGAIRHQLEQIEAVLIGAADVINTTQEEAS